MSENVHVRRFMPHFPGRFDRPHACRRPQVITDAVCPTKPLSRDDFFVVDSLVAVTRFVLVDDVSLAGE
jgi:hypothetical protein